ncbi:MAG: YicC family protein [Halioglobus sp.]|nr:YicC family protein [Halioglobus sp.]
MIQSMTAFARESADIGQGTLTVEVRSVNHRYLDCSFKLPDALRALEPKLREHTSASLTRGKIDCMMRLQSEQTQTEALDIDADRLDALLKATSIIQKQLNSSASINPLEVLLFPGVCCGQKVSEEQLQKKALSLFSKALENMHQNRCREGQKLATLILDRMTLVEAEVHAMREVLPTLMQHQRNRIIHRIANLEVEVEQNRLEQELVYMAQKADVDEELDRLDAHISEVRHVLKQGSPCGRRLDFLMQELNREANTLSSKSQSVTTTQSAVELKVLIEQMREQIQNVE